MKGKRMSLPWILFANTAVLGMLTFNFCFKAAGQNINAFAFTLILGCTQITVLFVGVLVAKYAFNINALEGVKSREALLAVLAGFAVLLIDISMFLAYRRGSPIMTNTYTSVGGIILFAVLSLILFHEHLTVMKGIGIALGAASLILMAF